MTVTPVGMPDAFAEFLEGFFPGETDPAIIGRDADPDGDGENSFREFVFGGDPSDRLVTARVAFNVIDANADGQPELVMTIAVRAGVIFNGDPQPVGTLGTLRYTVHGSDPNLLGDGSAREVPALAPAVTGLVAPLSSDYEFRSFALDGSEGLPTTGLLWTEAVLP